MPESNFESPLVAELYELVKTMVLPRLTSMNGTMGVALGFFIKPLLPDLPKVFAGMDQDLDLQEQIWQELDTRVERVRPLFLAYIKARRSEIKAIQSENKTGTDDAEKTDTPRHSATQISGNEPVGTGDARQPHDPE